MARKQSDYLAALLAEDEPDTVQGEPDGAARATELDVPGTGTGTGDTGRPMGVGPAALAGGASGEASPGGSGGSGTTSGGGRGLTLLSRESALARVASGEVRQVTQLLLDPARVRIWPGNARLQARLSHDNCRELIDSIIAEGGQKVPAIVRRVEGDPDHDYEVIAGTRRHWSIAWLRAHDYPEMRFVAQVASLDDEAAFRLADLENRARADVSDLERARNYGEALRTHYANHLTRMAERLKVSKGWLSKMIKVAALPDPVVAAFASLSDIPLKPAYALARAMDDREAARAIVAVARTLARDQAARRAAGLPGQGGAEVLRQLLDAPRAGDSAALPDFVWTTPYGRTALSVRSVNRQGVTIRLHAGAGIGPDEMADALRHALAQLEAEGRGLRR